MKKIIVSSLTFVLALCFVLAGLLVIIPTGSAEAVDENVTVYFYNSKSWEKVYAHCYVLNSVDYTTWPGVEISPVASLGEGWYSYTLPDDLTVAELRVQFNNGTDDANNKIDVRVLNDQDIYFNAFRGVGYKSATEALANNSEQVIESTGTTKIYYYNSRRWKTVYAYAYGTDTAETEYTRKWPGNIATKDETRENWYYIEIKQDCEKVNFKVIFNNGGSSGTNQSVDTLINNHKNTYINFDGSVFLNYESCEEVTELIEVVEEIVLNPEDFYLDTGTLDSAPDTITAINQPEVVAPIAVSSASAGVCVALGISILLVARRNKR